jgi:hypothetical protein
MAPGRARDERKERQWRRRINQWRASGLSVPAFCARHDLAPARFYHWRRVLERRAAEEPTFVPVQVVADAVSTRASALEVVLSDGRTVRVAPGFDAATAGGAGGGTVMLNFPPAVRIWLGTAPVDPHRALAPAEQRPDGPAAPDDVRTRGSERKTPRRVENSGVAGANKAREPTP